MRVALLGPQRFRTTLRHWTDRLEVTGPVATITAGWLERERDDDELASAVDLEVRALELWHRAEEIRQQEPGWAELDAEFRERSAEFRRLYRRRLDHEIAAAKEMLAATGDAEVVLPERRDALDSIRRLDARFLERIEEAGRPRLEAAAASRTWRAARDDVRGVVENCDAVYVAGGHVDELLALLRLFGLGPVLALKTVVAWSAGAMALTERVVGFHDRPPQGAGNAEMLLRGLGLTRDLVLLPDARNRLTLDDPHRVALMARRFDPALCVTLDRGASVVGDETGWTAAGGSEVLQTDGHLEAADGLELPTPGEPS